LNVSGLETAIRNALDRSERTNPEIRARIYQSARQALEAGLRKQDITDAETVSAQRQRLEATIRAIEEEEQNRLRSRVDPPGLAQPKSRAQQPESSAPSVSGPINKSPSSQSPSLQSPSQLSPQVAVSPSVAPPHRSHASNLQAVPSAPHVDHAATVRPDGRGRPVSLSGEGRENDLGHMRVGRADHLGGADPEEARAPIGQASAPAAAGMDFKPEGAAVRRRPRKIFSRILIFCLVVASLGMGAWWVKNSGLLMTTAERDNSVPNPPAHVDAGDYNGTSESDAGAAANGGSLARIDPQDGFSDEWIEVLKAKEGAKVAAGAKAKVEDVAESDGPAIRVTSATASSDGNVTISLPEDVVQKLVGKTSTVALTVQSISDKPVQIAVECDFQALGSCGRHRFDVARQTADLLFQLRLNPSEAASGAGRLILNSDVDGKGAGVNVYAVRILPGQ
jgi:hypothetical protein